MLSWQALYLLSHLSGFRGAVGLSKSLASIHGVKWDILPRGATVRPGV